MKNTFGPGMKFWLLGFVLLGGLLMHGCGGGKPEYAKVAGDDLSGRTFALYSVDGNVFPGSRLPTLTFGEDLQISGSFCNRFAGQAEIEDSVLSAKQLASTKMFCVDPYLNNLEKLVPDMLQQGVNVTFNGERLLLKQGGHVVEYLLQK